MRTYRTKNQYTEIVENTLNGNWTYAGKLAEEYGFYAKDLIKEHKERIEMGGFTFEDEIDLALIAEMAQKERQK